MIINLFFTHTHTRVYETITQQEVDDRKSRSPAVFTYRSKWRQGRERIPEGVGEADEGQRDDVVHHHDGRVLSPRVHVQRGVDGVAVETALDQVGDGDVCRHGHTALPVCGDTEEHGCDWLKIRTSMFVIHKDNTEI